MRAVDRKENECFWTTRFTDMPSGNNSYYHQYSWLGSVRRCNNRPHLRSLHSHHYPCAVYTMFPLLLRDYIAYMSGCFSHHTRPSCLANRAPDRRQCTLQVLGTPHRKRFPPARRGESNKARKDRDPATRQTNELPSWFASKKNED